MILITETIPKAQVLPILWSRINIDGYDAHTNFDPDSCNLGASMKRGITVFVAKSLGVEIVDFEESSFEEQLWCRLRLNKKDALLIGCLYRSPSSNGDSTTKLCNLLRTVSSTNPTRLLIVGDFNLPEIEWNNWTISGNEDNQPHQFVECLQDCFLYQHVTQPTRYRLNQTPKTLDLILTNEEGLISDLNILPSLGLSDHVCLSFMVKCNAERSAEEKEPYRNLNRGDYDHIRQRMRNTHWEENMESETMSDAWDYFKCTFNTYLDEGIPTQKPGSKPKKLYLNRKALRIRKKKYHHFKRWKMSDQYADYVRYTRERDALRSLTRKLCRDFEMDIAKNIKKNPKAFWKYVKSKLKTRSTIDHLTKEDGTMTINDEENAEVLNRFFTSVFTEEDLENIPTLEDRYHGPPLENIIITPEMITQKLKKLKTSKSPGPDGFHPRVLMETAEELSVPLTILFRKSLQAAELPEDWKIGEITPIHKKGSRRQPGNYRPVSLTSVIVKVLESIIRDVIVDHMMSNNLFADEQHGFVPGRSCMTQLLLVMEEWTRMLEEGKSVDVIYLDFQKAFDSVPHQRLLRKLEAYGVHGALRNWVEAFLTGRQQRVKVNGKKSTWTSVKSGIPQGSVLGPTLFVVFINDLPDAVDCLSKIFADDTKAYKCADCGRERQRLGDSLDALHTWSEKWQLPFNLHKCKCMHLGYNNPKEKYEMGGVPLTVTDAEKDLGVTIDEELKFHVHTNLVVNKANQILGLIARTFENLDQTTLPTLYKALVRPHLEYGNVIWGPRFVLDKDRVERVQRRATRLVPELKSLPYEERLKRLKLPSLSYRRRRGDMIQMFKIMSGMDRINPLDLFQLAPETSTRGHKWKVFKPRAAKEVRRSFFSQRVINDWNGLPDNVVNAETLNSFKNRLDKTWGSDLYSI